MAGFSFESPVWLLLLAVLPFLVWAARRTLTNFSPRQRRLQLIMRGLLLAVLALAAARLVWNTEQRRVSAVYAIDVSSSIAPDEIVRAAEWIEAVHDERQPDHWALLGFGATVSPIESVDALRALAAEDRVTETIDRTSTDLAGALDAARSAFAPGHVRRLVLLSDGHTGPGPMKRVVAALVADGVLVDTVPLSPRQADDAWVDGVRAERQVTAGEAFVVEVDVDSQVSRQGVVELRHGSEVLASAGVDLPAGRTTVTLEAQLTERGPAIVEAVLVADGDPIAENNVMRHGVVAGDRPSVLYVEGRPASARYLQAALEAGGLDVVTTTPARLPAILPVLGSFDAVVLSDVDAKAMPPGIMNAIEIYVRDIGGGLIVAGGEGVYGEEGYSDTALERALPVTFDIQEPPDEVAVVIALDKSWSMVGNTIELAKEATKAAVDVLADNHLIGILTFNHGVDWVVRVQPAENRVFIASRVSVIEPSGHTVILPAIEEAYRALQGVTATTRHVILLSDGRTYEDEYEELVTRMAREGLTVSTVAVGADADREFLTNIATWGHGRAYGFTDARDVPQIFVQETERVTRRSLDEEETRAVVEQPSAIFSGIPMDEAPPLLGYTRMRARDTAEVLLATGSGEPLLARWQYGLGRGAIFASDVKDRWSARWLAWPGYQPFWTRLVRDTMRRPAPDSGLRLTREDRLGGAAFARAVFEAVSPGGRFAVLSNPSVELTSGEGVARVALTQAAPGRYEAVVPIDGDRDYLARVLPGDGATLADGLPADALLLAPRGDELRFRPADEAGLRRLSEQTGGRFEPDAAAVAEPGDTGVRSPVALWPWLVALALLLFLADLLLRRVRIWETSTYEPLRHRDTEIRDR